MSYSHKKVENLRVLGDKILVCDMNFSERTSAGGIVLLGDDAKNSGIRPRWARVYKVGPEQQHIREGQYVLVSHGRWTRGLNIEDQEGKKTIRRIDNDEILLVSDEPQYDQTISDKEI